MSEIVCYDSNGKYIDHLTQWDIGQKIVVKGASDDGVAEFHFCTTNSKEALVVPAVSEGSGLSADIPDVLLQSGEPLTVHMYFRATDRDYSAKTVHTVVIPVNPRQKPSGYTYEEKRTDIAALLNIVYPVGAVYLSTNAIVPDSYLGGTWERIKDRFLVGAGNTYSAGVAGEIKTIASDEGDASLSYMPVYVWKRIA